MGYGETRNKAISWGPPLTQSQPTAADHLLNDADAFCSSRAPGTLTFDSQESVGLKGRHGLHLLNNMFSPCWFQREFITAGNIVICLGAYENRR